MSITYYEQRGLCANGRTYAANAARYRYFCAANRWPMGTQIELTSRSGQRFRVTVADRIGHGSDCDLSADSARVFMGRHFRKIGRVQATIRVVRRAKRRERREH